MKQEQASLQPSLQVLSKLVDMAIWNTFPGATPDDEEEVWIRIKYFYGPPFLAVWNEADQKFVSSDNSIDFPAWTVARWKSQ